MDVSRLVERFASLDVCSLSDALEQAGLRGALSGLLRVAGEADMAGPAVTLRLVPANGARAEHHLGARALDLLRSGDVIVVSGGAESDSACWGGLLARTARARGADGVIVDGFCRDVDEIDALPLSVVARGVHPRTARRRVVEAATNEPVTIADVTINPGDWVRADRSGVAVVPADKLELIVLAAERIQEAEEAMAQRLERGDRAVDVLGATYEELIDAD